MGGLSANGRKAERSGASLLRFWQRMSKYSTKVPADDSLFSSRCAFAFKKLLRQFSKFDTSAGVDLRTRSTTSLQVVTLIEILSDGCGGIVPQAERVSPTPKLLCSLVNCVCKDWKFGIRLRRFDLWHESDLHDFGCRGG